MIEFVRANAKAIAAVVTPLVCAWLVWIFDNAGIDITPSNDAVEKGIVIAITAVSVWFTRNSGGEVPE
jgi:hypothetical protein